jgi:hypothetical protein
MKKFVAATALSLCGVLAVPATAGAFNPQPDPPGKVLRVVSQLLTTLQGRTGSAPGALCHVSLKLPGVPPDPICPPVDTHG